MNTNSNLSGVGGVCNVTVPSAKKDLNAFIYIIAGLALHSLVSVVTLCNAGCKFLFTKIGFTRHYTLRPHNSVRQQIHAH